MNKITREDMLIANIKHRNPWENVIALKLEELRIKSLRDIAEIIIKQDMRIEKLEKDQKALRGAQEKQWDSIGFIEG